MHKLCTHVCPNFDQPRKAFIINVNILKWIYKLFTKAQ